MPELVNGKLVPSDSDSSNKSTDTDKNEDKTIPLVSNPLGPALNSPIDNIGVKDSNKIEDNPPANNSSVGALNPDTLQFTTHLNHPAFMSRVERVLRDGGMDSMSVLRSMQSISEIAEELFHTPVENESNKRIK
jgi:hypothetical protein